MRANVTYNSGVLSTWVAIIMRRKSEGIGVWALPAMAFQESLHVGRVAWWAVPYLGGTAGFRLSSDSLQLGLSSN